MTYDLTGSLERNRDALSQNVLFVMKCECFKQSPTVGVGCTNRWRLWGVCVCVCVFVCACGVCVCVREREKESPAESWCTPHPSLPSPLPSPLLSPLLSLSKLYYGEPQRVVGTKAVTTQVDPPHHDYK